MFQRIIRFLFPGNLKSARRHNGGGWPPFQSFSNFFTISLITAWQMNMENTARDVCACKKPRKYILVHLITLKCHVVLGALGSLMGNHVHLGSSGIQGNEGHFVVFYVFPLLWKIKINSLLYILI